MVFHTCCPFAKCDKLSTRSVRGAASTRTRGGLPTVSFLCTAKTATSGAGPRIGFANSTTFHRYVDQVAVRLRRNSSVIFRSGLGTCALGKLSLRNAFGARANRTMTARNDTPRTNLGVGLASTGTSNGGGCATPFIVMFPRRIKNAVLLRISISNRACGTALALPSASGSSIRSATLGSNCGCGFPIHIAGGTLVVKGYRVTS